MVDVAAVWCGGGIARAVLMLVVRGVGALVGALCVTMGAALAAEALVDGSPAAAALGGE